MKILSLGHFFWIQVKILGLGENFGSGILCSGENLILAPGEKLEFKF